MPWKGVYWDAVEAVELFWEPLAATTSMAEAYTAPDIIISTLKGLQLLTYLP